MSGIRYQVPILVGALWGALGFFLFVFLPMRARYRRQIMGLTDELDIQRIEGGFALAIRPESYNEPGEQPTPDPSQPELPPELRSYYPGPGREPDPQWVQWVGGGDSNPGRHRLASGSERLRRMTAIGVYLYAAVEWRVRHARLWAELGRGLGDGLRTLSEWHYAIRP